MSHVAVAPWGAQISVNPNRPSLTPNPAWQHQPSWWNCSGHNDFITSIFIAFKIGHYVNVITRPLHFCVSCLINVRVLIFTMVAVMIIMFYFLLSPLLFCLSQSPACWVVIVFSESHFQPQPFWGEDDKARGRAVSKPHAQRSMTDNSFFDWCDSASN